MVRRQQMEEQVSKPLSQFARVGSSYVFEFLGERLPIQRMILTSMEGIGLTDKPCLKIVIATFCL